MKIVLQSLIGSILFLVGIPINGFFLFGMMFESIGYSLWDINIIPLELVAVNFVMSFIGISIVLFNWEKLQIELSEDKK